MLELIVMSHDANASVSEAFQFYLSLTPYYYFVCLENTFMLMSE